MYPSKTQALAESINAPLVPDATLIPPSRPPIKANSLGKLDSLLLLLDIVKSSRARWRCHLVYQLVGMEIELCTDLLCKASAPSNDPVLLITQDACPGDPHGLLQAPQAAGQLLQGVDVVGGGGGLPPLQVAAPHQVLQGRRGAQPEGVPGRDKAAGDQGGQG